MLVKPERKSPVGRGKVNGRIDLRSILQEQCARVWNRLQCLTIWSICKISNTVLYSLEFNRIRSFLNQMISSKFSKKDSALFMITIMMTKIMTTVMSIPNAVANISMLNCTSAPFV